MEELIEERCAQKGIIKVCEYSNVRRFLVFHSNALNPFLPFLLTLRPHLRPQLCDQVIDAGTATFASVYGAVWDFVTFTETEDQMQVWALLLQRLLRAMVQKTTPDERAGT